MAGDRRWRRVERWVTAGLALALAALAAWRFGLFEAAPERVGPPRDPFQIVAVWQSGGRLETRSFILPRPQIAALGRAGRLFATIESLPGPPFPERPYRVFRIGDETEVAPEGQAGATEGGNRCLFAIERGVIAAMGGPLTAVVTFRAQLPETEGCGG